MKYILQLVCILAFVPILSCTGVHKDSLDITDDFFYIVNREQKLTIDDVRKLNNEGKLHAGKEKLSLGYFESNAWTYMVVPNPANHNIVLFENAHLDSIAIYCYDGDKLLSVMKGGDGRKFFYRSCQSNFPNFLLPENTSSIYIKVDTKGPLTAPVTIYPFKKYGNYLQKYNFIIGLYYGFIILIFISVVIIYIWTGERLNLYYAGFVFVAGLITAVDLGYVFQFVWPNQPHLNNSIIPFFYLLAFYFLYYVDMVLEIKRHSKILKYIFNFVYLTIPVLAILITLLDYEKSMQILLIVGASIPIISFISIFYLNTIKTNSYYKFMMTGLFFYILSMVVYILTNTGTFSYNLLTGLCLQIGAAVQIIFYNLSILSKIKILTKEKEMIMDEQNRILKNSNKELKKVNQDLDDFIYTASHDLRVPLANIQGLNNAMKGIIESVDKEKNKDLEKIMLMIDNSLHKQERTIMALTTIGKIQRMKELNISNVSLKKVIKNSLKNYEDLIVRSNATIHIQKNDFPEILFSESNCQSIINSLIKNALLYRSPERNLVIEIDYTESEDFIELTITDNGIGIKEGYQEKVFGLFTRLNTSVEGAGLGLYMTKQILENYDGKIDYESQYGKWTTFTIFFKKNLSQPI